MCLFWAAALHAAATKIKYNDIPAQIFAKNGQVQSQIAERDAAQSQTGYLERSFWPHMSLSLASEYQDNPTTAREKPPQMALDIAANLYRGGRDALEESQLHLEVQQRNADVYRVYLSELAAAQENYWQIVALSEQIRHHEDSLTRIRQATKAAKHRVSRGLTTNTDFLEFERQYDLISEQIDTLKQDQKERSMVLATQLGTSADIRLQESIPDPDERPLQTAKLTAEQHPDMTALQAEIDILLGEKSKLSYQSRPRLDVYSGSEAYTSDRLDLAAGIRMQMPLFEGMHIEKDQAALDHQLTAKRLLREHQMKALQTSIDTTQTRLRYLDQLTQRAKQRIIRTEVFLKATLADYDRGVKNASDVRNAIETYRQDKIEETERRLEYQITKVRLKGLVYCPQLRNSLN